MLKTLKAKAAKLKNAFSAKTTILTVLGVAFAGAAVAGSGGAEFDSIYNEVVDWLDGAPGKTIAVLAFGFAMFNVIKQNFVAAIGAFVGCLLMANAKTVIEQFLTAGLPL